MPAKVQGLGRIAGIEERQVHVGQHARRRRRNRRTLGGGVVADDRDRTAVHRGPGIDGVPQGIDRAIDARCLAVPETHDAVVETIGLHGRELGTHDRARTVFLVHRGPTTDGQIRRQPRGRRHGLVVAAQGRARVAGNQRGRIQSGTAIDAQLFEGKSRQGLDARQEDPLMDGKMSCYLNRLI